MLMADKRLNMAEWSLQPRFIKWLFAGAFLLLASDSRPEWPDRLPMADRLAALRYEPLRLGAAEGVMLTGAWEVSSDEPRFFGLSGLAVLDARTLVAVTDSGTLVDLPRPGSGGAARFRDLVGGPGPATFKKYRDAEALLILRSPRAPDAGGFEVAFENRHSVFSYAGNLWRTEGRRLPEAGWSRNKGAEAMVQDLSGPPRLLLLGEGGRTLVVLTHGGARVERYRGATGGVADAVRLPDGRMVVAVREIGLLGLTNRLAWLERTPEGYRLRNFATLPLGMFDNVEGLAAEPRPGGGVVLWAVTDNDGWRRTLLLRLELDATKAPAEAGA